MRKLFVGVAAAVAALGISGVASAHNATITGTSYCYDSTGLPVVTGTVTPWNGSTIPSRTNPLIGLFINKVLVGNVALTGYPVPYTISVPFGVTSGTVKVEAVALGSWGDGYRGGDSRSTDVELATGCTVPTTSILPPSAPPVQPVPVTPVNVVAQPVSVVSTPPAPKKVVKKTPRKVVVHKPKPPKKVVFRCKAPKFEVITRSGAHKCVAPRKPHLPPVTG